MVVKFLKANQGDCTWISYENDSGENRNIIIDGGPSHTYKYSDPSIGGIFNDGTLKSCIDKIKASGEKLDLIIVTHNHSDHIGGFLKWFKAEPETAHKLIGEVWYNTGGIIPEKIINKSIFKKNQNTNTSAAEGFEFQEYIFYFEIWEKKSISSLEILCFEDIKFTILSPFGSERNESTDTASVNDCEKSLKEYIESPLPFVEDNPRGVNSTSIAFLMEWENNRMVFLADSIPSHILDSLDSLGYNEDNPLEVVMLKVSHHGSKKNTSDELLKVIKTSKYIISSDGSNLSKECLSRIIKLNPNAEIYFNYPELEKKFFSKQDKSDYPGFSCHDVKKGLEICQKEN